jgi:iron complex transport system substrate-binding protein
MRVVSLLPSATEICYALGVEPVGVSHECDYPPAARERPAVNRSRVDVTGSSAEINDQVAAAETGEGVYAVDRDRLAALAPDLILTQGVCEVCAVDRVLVEEAVAELGLEAEVRALDVHSLAELYASIRRIGNAVGAAERASGLVADLQDRIAAVREGVPSAETAPSVAVLDWMDPVMVAGHWMPELVAIAGGEYGLETAGARSRPREWAELREYDPEALIVSPCGFELARIEANLADLTERPGWAELTAVERGAVYLLDGHHYVNRAGPRLVDTCEILAGLLWPERFPEPPVDAVRLLGQATV